MHRVEAAQPIVRTIVTLLASALFGGAAHAQGQDLSQVEIQTQKVADGLYMMMGAGGNLAVSVGEDGTILIDDQYAPLSEKIRAAIAKISEKPVSFLINTHWHGDHTGGNESFGKAGALIVAHDNVRKRMSVEQFQAAFNRRTPPSPEDALPVVTFTNGLTLHLNGGPIRATHVGNAHTDGDAIIFFEKQNTVHLGDTYFAGRFPFFDQSSGGSIDGMVAAADSALGRFADDTIVIPGHGPLSNVKELRAYREMLATVRDRVKAGIAAGKTLEQIQADAPTKGFESFDGGFVNAETFVRLVHASLSAS